MTRRPHDVCRWWCPLLGLKVQHVIRRAALDVVDLVERIRRGELPT